MIKSGTPRPSSASIGQASSMLIEEGVRVADQGLRAVGSVISGLAAMLPRRSCGCDIPPPCWMPVALGRVVSNVCPGGRAMVRLQVTNCSMTPREITAESSAGVAITGSPLVLGPMVSGTITALIDIPPEANEGPMEERLLWVHGCRDHFLRWVVRVRSRGLDSCHEVELEDCPDFTHHWYDHFYCERGCAHSSVSHSSG